MKKKSNIKKTITYIFIIILLTYCIKYVRSYEISTESEVEAAEKQQGYLYQKTNLDEEYIVKSYFEQINQYLYENNYGKISELLDRNNKTYLAMSQLNVKEYLLDNEISGKEYSFERYEQLQENTLKNTYIIYMKDNSTNKIISVKVRESSPFVYYLSFE